jgi:hypothetical protein
LSAPRATHATVELEIGPAHRRLLPAVSDLGLSCLVASRVAFRPGLVVWVVLGGGCAVFC